ncbi:MAG: M23 family metallopeptidase [Bacilli bacterium]|nr:M23 family metallopeptidase [Bacilli bacterium]MDD4282328.1 M23 family metallopeptidase [Bacilli bacterium]MDD4718332.1 M23 family metallopeptidase [Bacilli bacterium]
MKKIGYIIILLILTSLLLLGFDFNRSKYPNEYYQVYLEGKILGVVKSKEKLEKYIDKRGDNLKKQYKVDKVYGPSSLEIKKIVTYDKKTNIEEEIYNKISELKPFTVRGYQFNIKNEFSEKTIYTIDSKIFEEAVENTIQTFVGEELYRLYKTDNQVKIETVGSLVENVYLEDNITFKETNISVNEKIYLDSAELAQFLLFGSADSKETYKVKVGDTIENVAFNNKISVEEFLISNPEFTSKSNLLFPGQEVVIGIPSPQIRVVVEEHIVRDVESVFKPEIRYDEDRIIGDDEIIRKGENGLNRVTQKTKTINGVIVFVDPESNEELKPTINQIIVKGKKNPPQIGNSLGWTWPTGNGYVITTQYGYRANPFSNKREFHQALDIAIGYGADIYATNNGVVSYIGYEAGGYGNYIIINHNNGYYSLYAHLSRSLVSVGQIVPSGHLIAYMGSTGASTGPHLHFELWVGKPHGGGYKTNPWSVL